MSDKMYCLQSFSNIKTILLQELVWSCIKFKWCVLYLECLLLDRNMDNISSLVIEPSFLSNLFAEKRFPEPQWGSSLTNNQFFFWNVILKLFSTILSSISKHFIIVSESRPLFIYHAFPFYVRKSSRVLRLKYQKNILYFLGNKIDSCFFIALKSVFCIAEKTIEYLYLPENSNFGRVGMSLRRNC